MRGRRPKPTYLKIVAGNPGRRPLNTREPRPRGDLVEPPVWFSADQMESWVYAIESAPTGLLTTLDRSVLTIWVVAETIHRQAVERLARSAPVIRAPNGGPMQNPFLPIINRQALIMLRAAEQLGFSPASRSRIYIENSLDENEGNFFDD